MRVLYLDINGAFLNPTRGLISAVLCSAGCCSFFGPGYVSSSVLKAGLGAFMDSHGPFDLVLANTHVLFANIYRKATDGFRKWYSFTFPMQDLRYLPEIADSFSSLAIPRAALLLESDFYNWTARETDVLDRAVDAIIGFGPEFTAAWDGCPEVKKEKFGRSVTGVWPEYVRQNSHRIVSLPHFVSETEFSFDRLAHRPQGWSVLGINYRARREAAHVLRSAGVAVREETPVRRLLSVTKKFGLVRQEGRRMLDFLNSDFRLRLSSSRYSYTCGSALRMPIRKFFEIPAAGAVLVCQPFQGFADAGFRNGENAVCCEPGDVLDAHKALSSDLDWAQTIADAGRSMVFENHSIFARSRQFEQVLNAIAERRFAGAGWQGGSFVLRSVS